MSNWMSGYKSDNDENNQKNENTKSKPPHTEKEQLKSSFSKPENSNQQNGFTPEGKEKKDDFIQKIKNDERLNETVDYVWLHRLEFFYGILMVIGILIAFFYLNIGGALVGLAVGMCFQKELRKSFNRLSTYHSDEGVFKAAMIIGTAFYLLIAAPVFILAIAIGFGVMTVVKSKKNF